MNPARMIYEDAPAFIPVPVELQHQRIEAILCPLPLDAATVSVVPDHDDRELGDATEQSVSRILPSLAAFRATLPVQAVSASEFCREMRDEDRY